MWKEKIVSPAEMLAKIGEPAVEPLIEALASTDRGVRHSAAYALGKIGDVRAVQPLIELMKTETDPELKREMLQMLTSMDSEESNQYLLEMLEKKG